VETPYAISNSSECDGTGPDPHAPVVLGCMAIALTIYRHVTCPDRDKHKVSPAAIRSACVVR